MRKVKYAILGAGTAGLTALSEIRKNSDDFVLIEAAHFGTTCARVGCMPSKALIHCADHYEARNHLSEFGIQGAEHLSLDSSVVMNRVRAFRDRFTKGVQAGTTDTLTPEQLIRGHAQFIAPNQIRVNDQVIEAERFIIATGSRPVMPPAWQNLGDKLITSDDIFELTTLPKSIAVIGLGIIGLELGQALSRLGVKVHGIELQNTLGGLKVPEVIDTASQLIGQEFPIHLGVSAELSPTETGVQISFGDTTFEVEKVLAALGRRPNTDLIGLENIGVPLDERGQPPFNPNTMQIADLPLFLAGDANGFRPILHEAGHEGAIAVQNAIQFPDVRAYQRKVPMGIAFSAPQIGFFGQSYTELDLEQCVQFHFNLNRNNGRAIVMGQDHGMISLFADKTTKKLMGGELIMPHAEHFTHQLAWAVTQNLTLQQILQQPFYHPVLEEAIENALKGLARQLYTPAELTALVPLT